MSSGILGLGSTPALKLSLSHACSHSSSFTTKTAESSKQLLFHGCSQMLDGQLGNLGSDLLEEEKPTGISVSAFPIPFHSSARSHQAQAVPPKHSCERNFSIIQMIRQE